MLRRMPERGTPVVRILQTETGQPCCDSRRAAIYHGDASDADRTLIAVREIHAIRTVQPCPFEALYEPIK